MDKKLLFNNITNGNNLIPLIDYAINRGCTGFIKNNGKIFLKKLETELWSGIDFINLNTILEVGKKYAIITEVKKTKGYLYNISAHLDAKLNITSNTIDGLEFPPKSSDKYDIDNFDLHSYKIEFVLNDSFSSAFRLLTIQPNRNIPNDFEGEIEIYLKEIK